MKRLAAAIGIVCLASPAFAASPVVVELFTSQSCSSCPPADALLGTLVRQHADVLALDLHVTYWDRLGWKDPYSLGAATARQWQYARDFGSNEVYTPQMVIDGTHQAVGSDRAAVLAAIAAAKQDAAGRTGVVLDLARTGDRLDIHVGDGTGAGTIWLVGFDAQHVTHIGGGENGGRTLTEVNVVRSLAPVAAWRGRAMDVTAKPPEGERVAVLLQAAGGHIFGVAVLPVRG